MAATAQSQVKGSITQRPAPVALVQPAPTITTTIELITPEMAAQILGVNTANRPLSKSTVARYAADMAAGRWQYNGQDIIFSDTGKLIDGQHRMTGVVVADVPVLFGVKRGVPADSFATLDAGKSRTAGDILALTGHHDYNSLAAASRLALLYDRGDTISDSNASRREVTDFAMAQPYLVDAVKLARRISGRLNAAPVAAVIFLANRRRYFDQQIAEFIDGVADGTNLTRGDPRLTLREWAVSERLRNRGHLPTTVCFAGTIRAWNAFARAEDLKLIKVVRQPSRSNISIVGFHPISGAA